MNNRICLAVVGGMIVAAIVTLNVANVFSPAFADPDPHSGHGEHATPTQAEPAGFEAGPEGTVKLGNAKCPVMGGNAKPDVGAAVKGWWVNFCCPGCDRRLQANIDSYAEKLKEQTGIDIRRAPREYIVRPQWQFEAGPNGTKKLGNAKCPVMGGNVNPRVGTEVNGWWVNFCCPGCDRKLKANLDQYADALVVKIGIDIRKSPADYESRALPATFEAGPEGTVKLGNATCPVMGGTAKPDVGTAFNGWWVNFCCPGCDRKLRENPDEFAGKLLEATGIDIRKSTVDYMRRPTAADSDDSNGGQDQHHEHEHPHGHGD